MRWDVFLETVKVIGWFVLALWSWYMVNSNNKYFVRHSGDEKNTVACNLLMWFVVMVISVVKGVKMFA